MYADSSVCGHDKGYGIIEPMTSEHLKDKNKSAARDVDYPNLSLIVAYKGIVQKGE